MTIRFELAPPSGATHEVELPGPVAVLGRDPTCDLVLNDSKCSRQHAVVEESLEGLVIRDAGSANGLFVNGRRLERSRLHPGDTVRLGDVTLRVLEVPAETVVVGPEDLQVFAQGPPPARSAGRPAPAEPPAVSPQARSSPPPRRTPEPRPSPVRPGRGRPATVTVLCALWALAAPAWVGAAVLLAARGGLGTLGTLVSTGTGLALGLGSAVMALGLFAQAAWARRVQIAAAALGLLACPFTFASATVLLYMLRADVRAGFEHDSPPGAAPGAGEAEATFALSLLGMLALGLALAWGALVMFSGG